MINNISCPIIFAKVPRLQYKKYSEIWVLQQFTVIDMSRCPR